MTSPGPMPAQGEEAQRHTPWCLVTSSLQEKTTNEKQLTTRKEDSNLSRTRTSRHRCFTVATRPTGEIENRRMRRILIAELSQLWTKKNHARAKQSTQTSSSRRASLTTSVLYASCLPRMRHGRRCRGQIRALNSLRQPQAQRRPFHRRRTKPRIQE